MNEHTPSQWAVRLLRHLPESDVARELSRHATDEDLARMQVLDHLGYDRAVQVIQQARVSHAHMIAKVSDAGLIDRIAADGELPQRLRAAAAASPLCDPRLRLQLWDVVVAAGTPEARRIVPDLLTSNGDVETLAAMLTDERVDLSTVTSVPTAFAQMGAALVDLALTGRGDAHEALRRGIASLCFGGSALAHPRSHELDAATLMLAVRHLGYHHLGSDDAARVAATIDAVDGLAVDVAGFPNRERSDATVVEALARAVAERRITVTGRRPAAVAARDHVRAEYLRHASAIGVPVVLDADDVTALEPSRVEYLRDVGFTADGWRKALRSSSLPLRVLALTWRGDATVRAETVLQAALADDVVQVLALSPTSSELHQMIVRQCDPAQILRCLDNTDVELDAACADAIFDGLSAGRQLHPLLGRIPGQLWTVQRVQTVAPKNVPVSLAHQVFTVDPDEHGVLDRTLRTFVLQLRPHTSVLRDALTGRTPQPLTDDEAKAVLADASVAAEAVRLLTTSDERDLALERRLCATLPLASLDDQSMWRLEPLIARRMVEQGADAEAFATLVGTIGTWEATIDELVEVCVALSLPLAG